MQLFIFLTHEETGEFDVDLSRRGAPTVSHVTLSMGR